MKDFKGNVLFLDRSDINTDEIIPAKYLTEIRKEALKPHLLEDLKLEGFNPELDIKDKRIIVTRGNFGCGSSREHAVWALETNQIYMVIALSFARIFRQNMYNCGMAALELPEDMINNIFSKYSQHPCELEADLENQKIHITYGGEAKTIPFSLSEYDMALLREGGWVEYADKHY